MSTINEDYRAGRDREIRLENELKGIRIALEHLRLRVEAQLAEIERLKAEAGAR